MRRAARTLLKLNQPDGFDCPAAPGPSPTQPIAHCEFCENGAKAVADEATGRRVTPTSSREHSVADLLRAADHWLGQQGRLTEPMVPAAGRRPLRADRWDDAFALIADELHALASRRSRRSTPRAAPATRRRSCTSCSSGSSAPTTCPTARTCATSRAASALAETIGIGKGTVTLDDFDEAERSSSIGQNPARTIRGC